MITEEDDCNFNLKVEIYIIHCIRFVIS
jgi:hypothetical protein